MTAKQTFDIVEFRRTVYDIVRCIPPGRATSYGALARAAGYPAYSRMVGREMARCGDANLPAHRVVNSQGVLSGRNSFAGPGEMERRLESEGVVVKNNRIANWKKIFWNPLDEL